MKRLVLVASAMFWIAMIAIWSFSAWAPNAARDAVMRANAAEAAFTAEEVAAHADAASCWLIIRGRIYDVTRYIDVHPANPRTILDYCGKEATRSFETKDRGRPHSAEAERLLEGYRIGTLAAE
jgi:cytochrome b involved in lipid metabolism